jgi:hypothetical protein
VGKGAALLRSIRRFDLKANVRASKDPDHMEFIHEMRNMDAKQPISNNLLRSLNLLTPNAVHDHGASLRFAPIAVLSQRERHPFNLSQAQQFAQSHNKPLIKWKLPLAGPAATWITKDEEASIYIHEKPGVYGFFVEGAPCVVNRNLHTSRSLVNGCDGFMYSLTLHHDDDGNDDDDDDDDYNYSGSSKTLADYINEARKKHAIYADGSVLEVEIPMPFSVNICPTISDHHSGKLLKKQISMLPGKSTHFFVMNNLPASYIFLFYTLRKIGYFYWHRRRPCRACYDLVVRC